MPRARTRCRRATYALAVRDWRASRAAASHLLVHVHDAFDLGVDHQRYARRPAGLLGARLTHILRGLVPWRAVLAAKERVTRHDARLRLLAPFVQFQKNFPWARKLLQIVKCCSMYHQQKDTITKEDAMRLLNLVSFDSESGSTSVSITALAKVI